MHALNCWKHFEHTGKIEDYLTYKTEVNQVDDNTTQSVFDDKVMAESRKRQGTEPYAGFY